MSYLIRYSLGKYLRGNIYNHVPLFKTLNIESFSTLCQYPESKCIFPIRNSKLMLQSPKNCDIRHQSSQPGSSPERLPPLMDFPKITWPSLVKSIRNFILATFIIKPYFDRDFSLPDFVFGSKKAVEVVSKKIADGDIKALNGLVTSDILSTLQKAISLMSLAQREQIAINMEDIYFSFPYQVGVMFNEDNDQKRFVEITMVFHALKGLSSMRARGEEPPLNMGMLPEYQNRILVCNYRFIKEFTKGVESDWTINLLNHFKPADETQD